ncbi:NCS2 family permease [Pyxidicoccus sp. MSG2]|uniref:NCS2 family permease n=1 Tax=Pyxidicoccus sp. MSG2 TaxID=2996790 RepID=UPI00227195B0|nr:NCS2 family permease [Pyxidicoccus sp. MSG2]MCY1017480.1 NCS2 family permease [Pyxidicoccus sp. MSG2]
MESLERWFHLRERGTTVATELRAGVTTFLTMAYILLVNPQILAEAGMPPEDVVFATAVGSAVATFIMGVYANFPFALAPGMGINAYFTYGIVKGLGVDWRVALTAVFAEGLIFLVLSFGGVRTLLINAIPQSLKLATTTGIGLFLALIGLRNGGLVVASPETLVQLGNLHEGSVLLGLAGLLLIGALVTRRVKGALLIGIAVVAVSAWVLGLSPGPSGVFRWPSLPRETLGALDFRGLFSMKVLGVTLALFFVDVFDTAGTLLGVGRLGGFLTPRGELPGAGRAFVADAVGTMAGAALGTSAITTYIESAAGVEEGGRTGLTAVTVAGLFLLSLFCIPLLSAIPAVATAPALVAVGAMMMSGAVEVPWTRFDEALPAFLTVAMMPFTYSIAHGVSAGIVSYAVLKLLTGRHRDTHPVLYGLAGLLGLYHALV